MTYHRYSSYREARAKLALIPIPDPKIVAFWMSQWGHFCTPECYHEQVQHISDVPLRITPALTFRALDAMNRV